MDYAPDNVTTHYFMGDQVGTTRMELSNGGWPMWQGEYYPFGQEAYSKTTANHYKFTGKERDTESGLDYFGARYYGSSMGRFMSPDWSAKAEPVPYSSLSNPQTLNLYAYVGNNPLRMGDPDGHSPYVPEDASDDMSRLEERIVDARQQRRDLQSRADSARRFAKQASGFQSEANEQRDRLLSIGALPKNPATGEWQWPFAEKNLGLDAPIAIVLLNEVASWMPSWVLSPDNVHALIPTLPTSIVKSAKQAMRFGARKSSSRLPLPPTSLLARWVIAITLPLES
jgi:RHS repeat-associated protein